MFGRATIRLGIGPYSSCNWIVYVKIIASHRWDSFLRHSAVTSSIVCSAKCRNLSYSPMGVKFGMEEEEGTKGPLLHAKFHSHR